jgi:hypothetical protein
MIRGWFMDIPSSRGRVGIRIRESGLADRISHSELASELGGLADSGGVGVIGDSIGIITTPFITTAGTTPRAELSITVTPFIEVGVGAAEFTTVREP